MRNKYPGICYRCDKLVEKGEGHFEKIIGTKNGFRVIHAKCAIKQREEKLNEKKDIQLQRPFILRDAPGIKSGSYRKINFK